MSSSVLSVHFHKMICISQLNGCPLPSSSNASTLKHGDMCLGLLDETVKEGLKALGALLGISLLVVLIVDKGDAETSLVALGPLEVVHEGPRHVALDVDTVLLVGIGHGLDVAVEVFDTEVVLEDLLEGHVILALEGGTVLCDVDGRVAVALREPDKEVVEALGVGTQPERLGLFADVFAALGLKEGLEIAEEVVLLRRGGLVLDVVGRVVVHAVEVVGSLDKGELLRRKLGQAVPKLLEHGVGVLAEVDWVSEPGDGKLDLAVRGLDVLRVLGVPGVSGITVQGDTDLATIGGLELLAVDLDCAAVGDEQVVANDPGFTGRVTDGGLAAV